MASSTPPPPLPPPPPPPPPPLPPPMAQCSGGAASTSGQANVQSGLSWEQMVNHWYPKLEQEPCFLPHVHFNKLNYKTVQVGGQDVFVTEPPVDDRQPGDTSLSVSDARDDKTSQRLLYCLRQFATQKNIPMFVMQELDFSDYLADPNYSAVTQQLPRPCDLKPPPTPKKKKKKKKSAGPNVPPPKDPLHVGDFDLLIIHPDYGLLVGEVKTVGDTFTGSAADQQKEDDTVVKRVKKAIKQLNKERNVLPYMVSDFQPAPRVRATLILPNISRSQLQRVLNDNPAVQQDLSQCLDITSGADPLDLCLCADNLSGKATPYNVTDDVITAMLSWWNHTMTSRGLDIASRTHFRSIVARFAGPATTVRIPYVSKPRLCLHTVGEAVSETGRRFADIVLHPDQVAALTSNEPRLFLLAGPGCGKSILLVLRAVMWLQEGHHVSVVSIKGTQSQAACQMVHHQIQQMTDPAAHQRLSLHLTDIDGSSEGHSLLQDTVKDLLTEVDNQGRLFLIVDEAVNNRIIMCNLAIPDPLRLLYDALQQQVPDLHMWYAGCDGRLIPQGMKTHELTVPLRFPPVLVRLIAQSTHFSYRKCPDYSESDTPLPNDGLPVHEIVHVDGERGHCPLDEDDEPGELGKCEQCGMDTASYLLDHLHVGHTGSTTASSPDPLTYREVMVIPYYSNVHDEERDPTGKVSGEASPFVQGLRRGGLPVRVVDGDDATAMHEMAVSGGPDQVTVISNMTTVSGLERKVIVLLDSTTFALRTLLSKYNDQRFEFISRCTSQLVWIKL